MNKEEFQKLLDIHDWYYSSSDDMRIWKRGVDEVNAIKLAMVGHSELYELYKIKKEAFLQGIRKDSPFK